MVRTLWMIMALFTAAALSAQTIAEKKAGLTHGGGGGEFDAQTQQQLKEVNRELHNKQNQLHALYAEVLPLYERGAPESSFRNLVEKIQTLRGEMRVIEDNWRNTVTDVEKGEGYALWDQAETTVEQLVIDFGSQSYVYVIPPDIGKIPLSISSSVPIPRALWGEMLELILEQNGVGVRQLNPFLRILFLLKDNRSGVMLITNNRDELEYLPKDARIAFMISPDPADSRRVGAFLERFINPVTSSFSSVGRDLLVISTVSEIQELLKMYDFVAKNRGDLEYKLVPLIKVDTKEMTEILQGIFEQFAKTEVVQSSVKEGDRGAPSIFKTSQGQGDTNGLKVIPLTQVARAIFLLGTKDEIAKAEEIIREVESQVGTARGKIVFTYRVKHADPEELGKLLNQIYDIFASEKLESGIEVAPGNVNANRNDNKNELRVTEAPSQNVATAPPTQTIWPGFYQEGQVAVNPTPVMYTDMKDKKVNQGRANFLVDPKTSLIVMVVEPDLLPRLKDIIRRLDVRRQMVQLDVLLVERTITHQTNSGLNLLRIGTAASGKHTNSFTFNDVVRDPCTLACVGANPIIGITDFIWSRPEAGSVPAFDLVYRFLMTQSDTILHSNPSVITLNETPANITVNTETSISTGVLPVQTGGGIQTSGGGEAFTRAQYGVNITITPTIHIVDQDDDQWLDDDFDYVLLETDIHFDTLGTSQVARPDVNRRQIKNMVNVLDGQTVIMGGLRSKTTSDISEKIPYLGEIPGVGKLFGAEQLSDLSTEMFIFITPTIIKDPCEDIERVKREQFQRRPGDVPYFLCALDRARRHEKDLLFYQGIQLLLGPSLERCIPWGDDPCEDGPSWDDLSRRLRGGCHDGPCYP